MSEELRRGDSKNSGGGAKWLLAAAAAAILLGGGYLAWTNYGPRQGAVQEASGDSYYTAPAPAGPLAPSTPLPESATTDESAASSISTEARASAPARRATPRTAVVPEATIGVTPTGATEDSDEIVVTAPPRPIWARTPSARQLSALYPERALQRGREGEAYLHCTVQNNGALDCAPVEATPGGFGNAALRVARTYRHASTLANGGDATGTPVNLRVVFRMEDEARRRRS